MYSQQKRITLALLVSIMLAIITVSSTVVISGASLETEDMSIAVPGLDISDSAFAGISVNSTTPSDLAAYSNAYETISERPFVIEVDVQRIASVNEATVIPIATSFIENVFTQSEFAQLEIDSRITHVYGVLPRWSISFKNATITTHTRIEATVFVNAISGAVMGYSGTPIFQKEPFDNVSIAEEYAIDILNHFGFVIPSQARYTVENYSNMNTMIYSLTFRAAVNDVLVDSSFGTLKILIDGSNGGLTYIMLEWMEIQEIPREGIISADRVAQNAILTLEAINTQEHKIYGVNIETPLKMQLVWLDKKHRSGVILYDAFSGEIVEYRAYLGETTYNTTILLIAPIIGTLGFAVVAYLIGKSRIMKLLQT